MCQHLCRQLAFKGESWGKLREASQPGKVPPAEVGSSGCGKALEHFPGGDWWALSALGDREVSLSLCVQFLQDPHFHSTK